MQCKLQMIDFDWAELAEVLVGSTAVGRDLSILVSAWETGGILVCGYIYLFCLFGHQYFQYWCQPCEWCLVIFTLSTCSVINIAKIFNILVSTVEIGGILVCGFILSSLPILSQILPILSIFVSIMETGGMLVCDYILSSKIFIFCHQSILD